jgi:hypothetical protein
MHAASLWSVAKFGVLSGLGWMVDMLVFAGVVTFGASVFFGGFVGAVCGATFAFLSSKRLVFHNDEENYLLELSVYIAYQLALAVVLAAAIDIGARGLTWIAFSAGWHFPLTGIAIAAKVAVTPFSLFLNYVVARYLLRRRAMPDG